MTAGSSRRRGWLMVGRLGLALAAGSGLACSAVYPEMSTALKSAPQGRQLEPPPGPELLWIRIQSAEIPKKTRDGRQWDAVGGNAPDPFVILFADDEELFRTPVQSNTIKPTWPDQVPKNYRIPKKAKVRLELWDANPISNHPICIAKVRNIHREAGMGGTDLRCESGARVSFLVEPAHAMLGVGLFYELRNPDVYVSRVIAQSPAARAGIQAGDQILAIAGKDVAKMEKGEPQSLINSKAQVGVKLRIRHKDGQEREVELQEGPVYPLAEDGVTLR